MLVAFVSLLVVVVVVMAAAASDVTGHPRGPIETFGPTHPGRSVALTPGGQTIGVEQQLGPWPFGRSGPNHLDDSPALVDESHSGGRLHRSLTTGFEPHSTIRTEPWENEAGFRMIFRIPDGWDSA
jgi:hypothetical protein